MFVIENKVVKPEPDALLIDVFKVIWERDKSEKKERAMKELAYIEFCVSPRPNNPYVEYPDSLRDAKVADDLFGPDWNPDKKIKEAMEWYGEWLDDSSIGLRLYRANLSAVHKLIAFLEALNLEERTKGGTMVFDPKKVMVISEDSKKALKGLQELKEQVMQEDFSTSRFKGGTQVSKFEV